MNYELRIKNYFLPFNKVGCNSEEKINCNLFCSSLILHYLCSRKPKIQLNMDDYPAETFKQ